MLFHREILSILSILLIISITSCSPMQGVHARLTYNFKLVAVPLVIEILKLFGYVIFTARTNSIFVRTISST